eukprot:1428586-Rhodomonas_salina.4
MLDCSFGLLSATLPRLPHHGHSASDQGAPTCIGAATPTLEQIEHRLVVDLHAACSHLELAPRIAAQCRTSHLAVRCASPAHHCEHRALHGGKIPAGRHAGVTSLC